MVLKVKGKEESIDVIQLIPSSECVEIRINGTPVAWFHDKGKFQFLGFRSKHITKEERDWDGRWK